MAASPRIGPSEAGRPGGLRTGAETRALNASVSHHQLTLYGLAPLSTRSAMPFPRGGDTKSSTSAPTKRRSQAPADCTFCRALHRTTTGRSEATGPPFLPKLSVLQLLRRSDLSIRPVSCKPPPHPAHPEAPPPNFRNPFRVFLRVRRLEWKRSPARLSRSLQIRVP